VAASSRWLSDSLLILSVRRSEFKASHRAFGGARNFPSSGAARDNLSTFVIDPDFGFRPILPSGSYTRFGTLANGYAEAKRPGVTRLLFIGDSVTRRGHIVEALKSHYGSQEYEYWNAGVESFNTVQEVEYYRRFNRAIQPDHVILTFHLNDFETTPVWFREADVPGAYAPTGRFGG
jgi:hypothetical protein